MSEEKKKIPVIVLAFANEFTTKGFLRQLTTELKLIMNALEPAVQKSRCHIRILPAATQQEIAAVFQDEWYQDRVWIFHYGGHADEDELWLEGDSGGNTPFFSLGLAKFLGAQKGLKLVFLNGCATAQHAQLMLANDIPAVVATSRKVADAQAVDFASSFYKGLASGASIQEAFNEAEGLLLGKLGNDFGATETGRSLFWDEPIGPETNKDLPWRVFTAAKNPLPLNYWRLFRELNPLIGMQPLDVNAFIGTVIDNKYKLTAFLGQGGFGVVYKALHTSLDQEVAIKITHPVLEGYDKLKNIIFSGNKGLNQLRHPNVIRFYDTGETELAGSKRIYIVMELVNGKSLDQLDLGISMLDREKIRGLLDLALQICYGLAAAHATEYQDALGISQKGIIHGNLSSQKVLFTPEGIPKIIDFLFMDLAKAPGVLFEIPEEVKIKTRGKRIEDYYPPEVLSGQTSINKQTDIYGLGTIFLEVSLRKKLHDINYASLDDLYALLKEQNSLMPRYVAKIIFKALHPDPKERYTRVEEIINDFYHNAPWFLKILFRIKKLWKELDI